MPRKRKAPPQSARSKRQKYLDFKEKRKDMELSSNNQSSNDCKPLQRECHVGSVNIEVSSNNQSSNDSKPLQMECHVASVNSCNNNKGTRASLRLKIKREQQQKYLDFQEKRHKDMEVSSINQSSNESTRASLRLKRKREQSYESYHKNPEVKRAKVKSIFNKDRQAKRIKVKAAFDKDRAKKRAQMKSLYYRNPQVKKNNVKASYWKNPATKRVASKLLDRAKRALNPIAKKMRNKAYYKKNCMKLKAVRKARYLLKEPKRIDSFRFLKKLKISLRAIEYEVVSCFRQNYSYAVGLSPMTLCTTSCRVTATKLLHYALEERKEQVSELFKAINRVKKYNIKSVEDFGEGSHISSGEPYFYETCYKYRKFESNRNKHAAARIIANMKQSVRKDLPYLDPNYSDTSSSDESQKAIPVDSKGQCHFAEFHCLKNGAISKNKWKCTRNCRKIKKNEISVILQICDAFHKPVNRLMDFLYTIDHGCPYNRYPVGVIEYDDGELEFIELKHKGHNIMCHDKNSQCASKLRILRKASTHYATLRVVLRQIYKALQCFDKIIAINSALEGGDYKQLLNVTGIKTINNLLDPSHANTVSSDSDTSGLRDPDLENKITTEHARLIAKYEKEIFSFCDCSCCSCERLLSRKSVTKIEFSDSLVQNNTLLQQLWQHIRANNAAHDTDTFYICNYCKPRIF